MFYRRKIILALLQLFDGHLDKIRLQKLLFLFTQQQSKPEYDFIPYRFGCYSYSANADMTAMVKRNILAETKESFYKADTTDYLTQLKPEDRRNLDIIKKQYGQMSAKALMKYTYLNYPFYAIKSEAAEDILNTEELLNVKNATPGDDRTVLFTIGYEGISLEAYLLRLVKNNIKILVDVRNNPLSMKFGFSKNQLKRYCESLDIQYLHFPDVGIQSEQRQELKTQTDYDNLFDSYKKNNLPNTHKTQLDILNLLKQQRRIALTCFEANICQCHRKHLAEAIQLLPGFCYSVKHI